MHGDIFIRHLGSQLVLEAVDVNEDPVQFFLVGLKAAKPQPALVLPSLEGIFQIPAVRAVDLGDAVAKLYQRMPLEIPRGFKRVPISTTKRNAFFNNH